MTDTQASASGSDLVAAEARPSRSLTGHVPTLGRIARGRLFRGPADRSQPRHRVPNLHARVVAALQGLPVEEVTWHRVRPGATWSPTGVVVTSGAPVTVLATGRLTLSRALDVWLGPESALWCRAVPGHVVQAGPRGITLADYPSGELELLAAEPGILADTTGTIDTSVRRARSGGGFHVAIICWLGDPEPSLREAARRDPELFAPLYLAHHEPPSAPGGWSYHPRLGPADIFTDHATPAGREITCHTHADVGILRHPVDHELTGDLRLSWSWKVESLPGSLPEHTAATHDYLSVAAEFDDGRDLTWMWSSTLPTGHAFACPLPWWDERETHLVIRSGTAYLSQWVEESRPVLDDALAAGYTTPPRRIVAIWLIANSTIGRGRGHCTYRDLRLNSPGKATHVLTTVDHPRNESSP